MSQGVSLQINTTAYGQPPFAPTDEFAFDEGFAIVQAYAFSTGFQTITPPSGTVGVKITNLDGTLTIKGINGDTGFVVTEAANALFPLMIPITSVLTLSATAGATGDLLWYLN